MRDSACQPLSKRTHWIDRGFCVVVLLAAPTAWAADGKESFQRSVEADIAMAEAESADNPKHARDLFTYARELVPDDADVWFHSARFEEKQGNQEKALEYLTKAVALNPQHPLAPFERALLLYTLKRTPEAKAAFEAYRVQSPLDLRAAHYLGLIALEADDFQTAKAEFDVARKGDDRTAAYAAAYFAIVSAQLGDPNAGALAKDALAVAPTPELKQKLEPLALTAAASTTSSGSDRYLPWVNLQLTLSTEYDTNVSLGALSGQNTQQQNATDLTTQQPGFRFMEDARVIFRPVAGEKFTLELEGDFLNANHDRESLRRFDFGGPAARGGFSSRFGDKVKLEFGVDGNYRGTWTNAFKTNLVQAGNGSPFVGVTFWPRHSLYAIGTVEYRNFIDQTLSPPTTVNDRDGMVYSAGLFYQVPFWWFDGIVNAAYDKEQTTGKNFRLNGVRASAALRLSVKDFLTATAYFSINFRWYGEALGQLSPDGTSYPPFPRNERRYETGVNVRYYPVKYVGIGASYAYTKNDAFESITHTPYDLYTYQRHVVSLTLSGQY
jgi:tetratricopeptide (TPR) repeat protein